MRSLEAGASGYLLKDEPGDELLKHILEVVNGGSPISPLIARQLLNRMHQERALEDASFNLQNASKTSAVQKTNRITDRELSVIQQVARGFTVQEIANQMEISAHTVSTHVKRIYKKLRVNSRSEAVYEASLLGLIEL